MKELMKNAKRLIEAREFVESNYDEGIEILQDRYAELKHGQAIEWAKATGLFYRSIGDFLWRGKKISPELLSRALIGAEEFRKKNK